MTCPNCGKYLASNTYGWLCLVCGQVAVECSPQPTAEPDKLSLGEGRDLWDSDEEFETRLRTLKQ